MKPEARWYSKVPVPTLVAWCGWLLVVAGVSLVDWRAGIAVAGAMLWYDAMKGAP